MIANIDVVMETVKDKEIIKELLLFFDPIFPHLREKITSYDEYADKLSSCANVIVCKVRNEIAGILVYYANDLINKTAYISLIGVCAKWQGKAISSALLGYCIRESLLQKMHFIKLEVDLDNSRAIRFYLKNGFEKCDNNGEYSIYMRKVINESKEKE